MKCKTCKAFGIDNLGFHGCLIRHTMEDLPDGTDGCKRREKTIIKEIATVKAENPCAARYRWLNQQECEGQ